MTKIEFILNLALWIGCALVLLPMPSDILRNFMGVRITMFVATIDIAVTSASLLTICVLNNKTCWWVYLVTGGLAIAWMIKVFVGYEIIIEHGCDNAYEIYIKLEENTNQESKTDEADDNTNTDESDDNSNENP